MIEKIRRALQGAASQPDAPSGSPAVGRSITGAARPALTLAAPAAGSSRTTRSTTSSGTCGARGRRPRAPGRDREHRRYLRQAALESSSLDTKDKAFSDDFFAGLTSAQTGDDEAAIPLLEKVV